MGIVGQVDTILGVSWEDFGATWVDFGAILGYVGAILGPFWEVLGPLWEALGGYLGPSSAMIMKHEKYTAFWKHCWSM